jgi:bacterioferritin (cytochrome b1)
MPSDFPAAIDSLRETAKAVMQSGAEQDVGVLDVLLTAEWLCACRYEALAASPLAGRHDRLHHEFREMEAAERRHVALLVSRITALGGEPSPPPEAPAMPELNLVGIAASNILAERGVIKLYRAALRHFARRDKETVAMLRRILDEESRHISAMSHLVALPAPISQNAA